MNPTNPLVGPMLTDLYQLTMAYAYWRAGKQDQRAVFDLFYRTRPFGGTYAIFAGLEECLRFLEGFRFTDADLAYLRQVMPRADPGFFDWLRTVDCSRVTVWATGEGSLAFPRVPMMRVEGPLAVAQLLETTLLSLVNYPSLVATCASRFRLAAGWDKTLLEFGLRRAPGPDGGLSASRYAVLGGFDATSNVLAGKLFDVFVRGTHAHAYVESFRGLSDLKSRMLVDRATGAEREFVARVLEHRDAPGRGNTHEGELAAFINYAQAFPDTFLALVDTYDTLRSGVPNFISVALALEEFGYAAAGIRLDSGDLAYLSNEARRMFGEARAAAGPGAAGWTIVASNDIGVDTIQSLNAQGHSIDVFGIGTKLVTCEGWPSLGGVYKLVALDGEPRIKLSNQIEKITLPGRKVAWRLYGKDGKAIADLLCCADEAPPQAGEPIVCRDPFDAMKRMRVTPSEVECLLQPCWAEGTRHGDRPVANATHPSIRHQLGRLRDDHTRFLNPTPYKVSVSEELFRQLRRLVEVEQPVAEVE